MLHAYPIEKIWQVILQNAQEGESKSIHIEPGQSQVRVRYEHPEGLMPSLYLPPVLGKRLNDYARSFSNGYNPDLAVEFLPTVQGEKIFVRLFRPNPFRLNSDSEWAIEDFLKEIQEKPQGLVLFKLKARSLFERCLDKLRRTEKAVVLLTQTFREKLKGAQQIIIKPEIGLDHSAALNLARRNSAEIIFLPEALRPELSDRILSASKECLFFTFLPATRLEPVMDWLGVKDLNFLKKDFIFLA